VSVPFSGDTADQARAIGEQFIAAIYPVFIDYIKGSNSPTSR
jgi:hypothetical protein